MKKLTQENLKRFYYLDNVVKSLEKTIDSLKKDIKLALKDGESIESGNMNALVKVVERSASLSKNKVLEMFSDVLSREEIERRINNLPKSSYETLTVSPVKDVEFINIEIDDYAYTILNAIPNNPLKVVRQDEVSGESSK